MKSRTALIGQIGFFLNANSTEKKRCVQSISARCSLFCLNDGITISWAEWLRVGRIEKIEAAIASLPEKGRAWNKEYINDEWMDGEQVCRYLGISGRTLQRLRSDHVITYSAINRKLYYSLTEIRRVLKERSVRRKNRPKE